MNLPFGCGHYCAVEDSSGAVILSDGAACGAQTPALRSLGVCLGGDLMPTTPDLQSRLAEPARSRLSRTARTAALEPQHHLRAMLARYGCMVAVLASWALRFAPPTAASGGQSLEESGGLGRYGGRLTVAERTEPKTLNPVTAVDLASQDVIRRMNADLVHINRASQRTEPALARSWAVSPDGRIYTITLRRGVQFSDGYPLTADDVAFSFRVYLDPKLHAAQRDMLVIGGKPIQVREAGPYTVKFELAQPYAAAERLFDNVFILPRHLLEAAYRQGKLQEAWSTGAPPRQIAGLGAFRLKSYVPGERLALERNPYYWKVDRRGTRLPYLNEIDFIFAATEEVQALRFEAGEIDVISGLSPLDFPALAARQQAGGYRLYDVGPGLEYDFLFFNLNHLPSGVLAGTRRKRGWFQSLKFRQAISAAIDRAAVVRLVYRGLATPLWSNVTPGNKLWMDSSLPKPPYSLARARRLLESAGFHWDREGNLQDEHGATVQFSIITSAGNPLRAQIATILQSDLARLGMNVHVVPLEFHSVVDRVFKTHDYDACLLGLISGDTDPNPEMNVWLSNGTMHLWNLGEHRPGTPWEAEIDRLMRKQEITLDFPERKRLYDRVQLLVQQNLPLICIVSPDILVGAKTALGNFSPAILGDSILWNADELFWGNGERPKTQ
jgi:peptide/nickel transport system substrate-binding protein